MLPCRGVHKEVQKKSRWRNDMCKMCKVGERELLKSYLPWLYGHHPQLMSLQHLLRKNIISEGTALNLQSFLFFTYLGCIMRENSISIHFPPHATLNFMPFYFCSSENCCNIWIISCSPSHNLLVILMTMGIKVQKVNRRELAMKTCERRKPTGKIIIFQKVFVKALSITEKCYIIIIFKG